MRVLVTGDRNWDQAGFIAVVLDGHLQCAREQREPLTLIEGGCPTGADHWARQWFENVDPQPINSVMGSAGHETRYRYGSRVYNETFRADWKAHGKAAGPKRNLRMIEEGMPNVVLAFKNSTDWNGKGGTEHCAREARAAGIPVYVMGAM